MSNDTLPDEIAATVQNMLRSFPEVKVGKKFHSTNFTIDGKVFGFTKDSALVIKLPDNNVEELLASGYAQRLVMGKRTMKQWVVVSHPSPADYRNDLGLIELSMRTIQSR